MSLMTDLVQRFRALVFRARVDRELEEELRTHLDFEIAERIRAGARPAEARRQALVAFGGVERWKEETREARGLELLDGLALDLRHAIRSLRRNPGFALAVVLVLGLGIGATTAVFSVVKGVLLNPLPYPEADRLVRIYEQTSPTNIFGLSVVDVQAIEREQKSFAAFGALQRSEVALSGAGGPSRVLIGRASSGFFQALSVQPSFGRLIQPDDERLGAPAVVVVSHALAEASLGGAARAVGQTITLDGVSHLVVGVLAPGVDRLAGASAVAWSALRLQPPTRRGPFFTMGIARLRPGVTLAAGARDLEGISQRLFPLWASSFRGEGARLTPYSLQRTIVGDSGRGVTLFAAAVILVLLITVANVATLMLVRASAREQELAVRAALGAGRARLARLLLVENLTLTILSGLAGLGTAWFALRLLSGLAPNLPRLDEIGLDAGGLAFALLLALVAGVLITLTPMAVLLGVRRAPANTSRGGVDRRTSRLRTILVTAEFALAVPLLLGAGLLLNSFLRLSRVDPGFDPAGVVTLNFALPQARYPDPESVLRFWNRLEARAAEIPGVKAGGLTTAMPPDDPSDINNFDLLDRPVPDGVSEHLAPWSQVTSGYFGALGIPLLQGRLFQPGDTGTAAPVVIVSRAWAARYYPGEQAVGRQLYSGGCRECVPSTVVGVVGDVKYLGLSAGAEAVYEPVGQTGPRYLNLMLRSSSVEDGAVRALVRELGALDPELPLEPVLLDARVRASLADPGRWLAMVTGFGLAAALLAALGIYGLMSYVVRQRQRELGVRLALGAAPGSITWMVIARGMKQVLAGSLLGLGLAGIGAGWVRASLFEVSPWDPLTLIAVGSLVLSVALISCWLPGRRAARVSLTDALRAVD